MRTRTSPAVVDAYEAMRVLVISMTLWTAQLTALLAMAFVLAILMT